ncbi:hypothetical protein A3C26_02590 [Candidatus Daviesbacteria bacterium RIFCSPHIGHO2_02_FULL_39_12]|uniref:Aspartyl/glutamyl-tRNA(Asn/Gln) amidotransferase subunit B n=2 Tax=Candidatus Daviesiibacteriota TaxID=1752718 RepID=A0A1F5JDJ4_9BACT|nr:MAG: hypothetical protein A3C26_02590 [Candidatus Daviesbacteria bacterium RIFCSPHIGHO2_02_FULL_39_12]OGE71534.1 MAG: hypothetical protein A3H40_00720 [Candidatus Daviesbacteria bacterium RIFCSPLOWO2_02_FULL_38_15]
MKYEPVIGLEVHVELNTVSKMFCRCSADYFGAEQNTHTCPVCLGLPGALPYINEEAVNKCIQIGLALNCTVTKKSLFERKNYFYPDLPKGYQISQYRWPLCIGGRLWVVGDNGEEKEIRINRVHQEEDTAKLVHQFGIQYGTLIDFNRSGVPLVEIVTEPDFTQTSQIRDYAKKLQQIFRYLGVSEADMEKGQMRLEANISVKREGERELPKYRVELKNINSFRFMVAAVEYEIKRQIEVLEKGEKIAQETRGWNEDKKCTYIQRSKEEAHDYRYFPEPDLPELILSKEKIQRIKDALPELPQNKSKGFEKDFGLTKAQAAVLTDTKGIAEFFEEAVQDGKKHAVDAKQLANFIINRKINIEETLPAKIIEEILGKHKGVIADEEKLGKLAKQVIKENPKAVEDYRKGKETALQVLIGGVMRLSSGKADISKLKPILEKLLS